MDKRKEEKHVKTFDHQLVYIYTQLMELQWSLLAKQKFYQQVPEYCRVDESNMCSTNKLMVFS